MQYHQIRVRFAPSPTGELHVGGARTALLNWLFARSQEGTFLLRIDDTDWARSQEDYLEGIFHSLQWMGIDWDEGPYYQSNRLKLYREKINELLQKGKAYRCFCTEEELNTAREKAKQQGLPFLYPGTCRNMPEDKINELLREKQSFVVRLSSPEEGVTVVEDYIKGEITFENRHLDDFIIMKSNGVATYNFASAVDEISMDITHVIRAEEHLSNTPRQIMAIQALEQRYPYYAHVPMILASDRSKLSKRHGATSVEEFKEQGFLPEALVNYLTLLGWSPPEEEEIFTVEKALNYFSLHQVGKTAAVFDVEKLTWINGHYIREMDLDKLVKFTLPFFQQKGLVPSKPSPEIREQIKEIISVSRDRVKTLQEFPELCAFFFTDHYQIEEDAAENVLNKEETIENLKKVNEALSQLENYTPDQVQQTLKALSKEQQTSPAKFIKPLRAAVSGKTYGPDLANIVTILGKEKTLDRINRTIELFKQ